MDVNVNMTRVGGKMSENSDQFVSHFSPPVKKLSTHCPPDQVKIKSTTSPPDQVKIKSTTFPPDQVKIKSAQTPSTPHPSRPGGSVHTRLHGNLTRSNTSVSTGTTPRTVSPSPYRPRPHPPAAEVQRHRPPHGASTTAPLRQRTATASRSKDQATAQPSAPMPSGKPPKATAAARGRKADGAISDR